MGTQAGFKYIQDESFESTFEGLFSKIDLASPKLGKTHAYRNAKLCTIILKIAEGLNEFSTNIVTLDSQEPKTGPKKRLESVRGFGAEVAVGIR